MSAHIAILGVGYAVPSQVRGNNDPIFDWLRDHPPPGADLFDGLKYRRVLERAEDVVEIMVQAARRALDDAGLTVDDIDMMLGSGSVSQFNAPNDLCLVHHRLGLPSACRVISLNTEYTNFHDGLKLAHELALGGAIRHALVVCGNNWTHHMDYHEPVSLAASDGAGAAVVGPTQDADRFTLIGWDNETRSDWYGALRQTPRASPAHSRLYTTSLMKLDDKTGMPAIKEFGIPMGGQIVQRLMARHGLRGQDITLMTHQTSLPVHQAWQDAIQPAAYPNTLEAFGDMVSSSVPVNLAKCYRDIRTDHLVLMGIGMEMHATALLYRRGQGVGAGPGK